MPYNVLSNSEYQATCISCTAYPCLCHRTISYETSLVPRNYALAYRSANLDNLGFLDEILELFEGLLGFFKKVYEELEDFAKATASAVESVVRRIVDATINLVKASLRLVVSLMTFDWDKIKEQFKEFGYALGEYLIATNVFVIYYDVMSELPHISSILREIDRFTGGLLTTTRNFNTLFGRALKGESISKEELMSYAVLAIQIAAIVLTGGGAAAWVGLAANQLSQGSLGKTEFGRELLQAIAIAATAYALGTGVQNAMSDYAVDVGMREGQELAVRELDIDSDLEMFLFQGVAMAGAGYYSTGSVEGMTEVVTDFSYSEGKKAVTGEVSEELARHIPSKYANQLSAQIVSRAENTDITNINLTEFDKSIFDDAYSFDDFLTDMQNAGASIERTLVDAANDVYNVELKWPDMAKFQDQVNEVANSVYQEVTRTPENIQEGLNYAYEEGKEKLNELKNAVLEAEVSGELKPLSLDIKIPDIKSPDFKFDADFEKLWDLWAKYNQYFGGKKAMYRRKYGRYTIYLLEDGSYYYLVDNTNLYLLALMAAGALATQVV